LISETVNQRRIDNTMTKGKSDKMTSNDLLNITQKLKISEAVNIRTENTMAKRQKTK
jgi:hypothetical protein